MCVALLKVLHKETSIGVLTLAVEEVKEDLDPINLVKTPLETESKT